jgi:hypothetical protein
MLSPELAVTTVIAAERIVTEDSLAIAMLLFIKRIGDRPGRRG